MGMTHDRARQLVRIAQICGIGLGGLAAAAWAMEVPGLGSGIPRDDAITQPPSGGEPSIVTGPGEPTHASVDKGVSLSIARNLDIAARRPSQEPQQAIVLPQPDGAQPSVGPEIRYLGPIEEPERMVALLSIDGHQRMLAENRSSGNVRMVEVTREHVIVEIGRERRTIPLAERTGHRVARIAPGSGAGVVTMPGGGASNAAAMLESMGAAGVAGVGRTPAMPDARRGSTRPQDAMGSRASASARPRGPDRRDPNSIVHQNAQRESSDSVVPPDGEN